MRINEIICESPAYIKLLLANIVYNLYDLKKKADSVKQQYKTHNLPIHTAAVKTYLSSINQDLLQIAELPLWNAWAKTADGKLVQREIDKLFNDNIEFMERVK